MHNTEIYFIINQSPFLFHIFFFIIGACLASFFNVYSIRYTAILNKQNAGEVYDWLLQLNIQPPKEVLSIKSSLLSLSFPPSHCPKCNTLIKWYENIPMLSWVFLAGKCSNCKSKISIQYPIVELFGGLLGVFCSMLFLVTIQDGASLKQHLLTFSSVFVFIFTTYLLLLVDWKTMYLPDEINYFLLWFGLFFIIIGISPLNIDIEQAILGVIFSYMFFWVIGYIGMKIKGQEVIGGGDLKLVASMAPFFGLLGIFSVIFLAPFIAIFYWLILHKKQSQFPFGPALILSAWINILLMEITGIFFIEVGAVIFL